MSAHSLEFLLFLFLILLLSLLLFFIISGIFISISHSAFAFSGFVICISFRFLHFKFSTHFCPFSHLAGSTFYASLCFLQLPLLIPCQEQLHQLDKVIGPFLFRILTCYGVSTRN